MKIISTSILAVSIAVAGYFIGNTLYKPQRELNTTYVKGLSERIVDSNKAIWDLSYKIEQTTENDLYKNFQVLEDKVLQQLKLVGLQNNEIDVGFNQKANEEIRDEDKTLIETKYYLSGSLKITTKHVKLIKKAAIAMNGLIKEGNEISMSYPHYYFTKLNEIKPQMIKEATQNARKAAQEFANNSGVQVGTIKEASQGRFSINDEGSSYSDNRTIRKTVRIVAGVTFYLES